MYERGGEEVDVEVKEGAEEGRVGDCAGKLGECVGDVKGRGGRG